MKKGLVLIFLLVVTMFATDVTLEASSVNTQSYSAINEFDGFTNVVIFIKFQDETAYQAPHDYDYYLNMFNGVDQISLRDYYKEVSYNQLTIDSVFTHTEVVYFVDEHTRDYYRDYDVDTNPIGYSNDDESEIREHTLLKNAVDWVEENNLIPDTVDLDVNNDGDIDSITFMVSGEDNGWNNLLWPHKWEIYSFYDYDLGEYKADAPMINGLYAWSYTFELLGNSIDYDYKVDVAVLAHETFHLISAPDLYHYYDYDWIDPIGEWGLMGSIGTVPSHMLGYMKYQYGNWASSPTNITENGYYELYPLQESGQNMYKIPLGYGEEYIYIEYRDNEGFYESTLPSSGLIVYRIDESFYDNGNVDGYYYNSVASEEVWVYRPEMTDITYPIEFSEEEPVIDVDGEPSYSGLSNLNEYDEIGLDTDILLFDSAGNEIEILITNIIEHDGYISFSVFFGDEELPELELNGNTTEFVEYGEDYIDKGYSVSLEGFENVEVTGAVDSNELGDYFITYTLKDSEDVVIDIEVRTVRVVDTTPPTVELNPGIDTIFIGENWVDPGVLVSDNYTTQTTLKITDQVDNSEVGQYRVTYKALDSNGNYTTLIRYVNVVEKSLAKSTFTCDDSVTTFTTNQTPGIPVCYYSETEISSTNIDSFNLNKSGTYEILYQAIIDGESHTFRKYIFIIDTYQYEEIVAIIPEERRRSL